MPTRFACLLLAGALQGSEPSPTPVPLFDGKGLDGWIQRGGRARYEAREGAIVGTAVAGGPNSFLCTRREYADFELELEFRVDEGLNSGVQIRSHARSAERDAVVFGYQIEIDPSPRAWTGGLYEESGRGWLDDPGEDEAARAALARGRAGAGADGEAVDGRDPAEWSAMRVIALGDSIRTWINGVPVTDYRDARSLSGFIALQVHAVPAEGEGLQVAWRSIRLRELGAHEWRPLWDGVGLSGWTPRGGARWSVEAGRLVGTSSADEEVTGVLASDAPLGDHTLRLEWRVIQGVAGIDLDCRADAGTSAAHGLVAVLDAGLNAGGLWDGAREAWLAAPHPARLVEHLRGEGWNEVIVHAHGRGLAVDLNGWRSAQADVGSPRSPAPIGLHLEPQAGSRLELGAIELLAPEER